ncbi:hypothetical protein Vqi01_24140 [Micromonospora qiuiae]|uniref:Uncharacterized protein n=1 Tax=Micromonospora qiuiae TaxID=502268 RepID=A0ABQ4JAN6_9ACTN|nr:hypothetical protein Vqi01_24140 [Micromonospora qiuiae]
MLLLVEEGQVQLAEGHRHDLDAQLRGVGVDRVDHPPGHGGAEGARAGAARQDKDAERFR